MNLRPVIVLTGGAGFIGSCFLWKLNQEGIDNVIVVDNLTDSCKWKNLPGKRFQNYIQKDDFLSILESGKLPGVKTIVHLGACSSTILNDAAYFLKNNYEYSKRLAAWAEAHAARFIYASSAATYGDGSNGYNDAESTLQNLRPLNIYGYTKHLFDLWMLKSGLLKKFVGFKFFNVFGPNEYHKAEMMSVICKRFDDVKSDRPIRLFKSYHPDYQDGEQKRDFVYVKDAIEVIYYFFRHPDKAGIFNLGSGKAQSWNELAEAMFLALGKKPGVEYIEMPAQIRDKYQYFTQAKMEKIRVAGCRHKFMALGPAVKDYASYLKDQAYL
ncbi:MAG: ADP-glyceromanno-heptose 6-epimerase [Candidatus Omnitrophota bacterium]|nr:ADP-glyceromanno-heptose 6-epimerase [Candidatus Omnitrophota bacterium]